MIPNPFKRLFGNTLVTDPVRTGEEKSLVALEGEARLAEIRLTLANIRADYAAGRFNGHPEETLEAIEDCENAERILVRAQKRGWVPDEKVIAELKEDMKRQEEFMVERGYFQPEIDSEIAWRQGKLDDALKGLR